MLELFSTTLKLPEGFSYVADFLTTEEEAKLIDIVRDIPLHPMIFQGFEAKRKVASSGFDYSFDNRKLSAGKPIPEKLHWLVTKVADHTNLSFDDFAELLVTEYPVGAVINWHRDAPPFDMIVGISLSSDCTFKLRPHEKERQTRAATISLPVARRSLYVMKGPSREQWQHSILPVKQVRHSITLRTLRK